MAHPGTRILRARLVAVASLVALAATYLTPLVNADWNAWRHDHGHASLSGIVGAHSHPWDEDHAWGDVADGGDEGGGETAGLVYTASGDSVPGLTAIWARPPEAGVIALSALALDPAPVRALPWEALPPTPPPPREALSHA